MSEEKYFRRKETIEESVKDSLSVLPDVVTKHDDIPEKQSENTEEVAVPATVEQQQLTVSASKEEIVERIKTTNDINELKDLANLFGVSLTKKEIERASRESDLVDTLLSLAEDRINNRGDYLSNDEVLEFLKTFQTNVDKSKKNLNSDVDEASSKYASTHNEINITVNNVGDEMSRESRERVLEVVNMIINSGSVENMSIIEPEELKPEDEEEESL